MESYNPNASSGNDHLLAGSGSPENFGFRYSEFYLPELNSFRRAFGLSLSTPFTKSVTSSKRLLHTSLFTKSVTSVCPEARKSVLFIRWRQALRRLFEGAACKPPQGALTEMETY
jgi:hypothetical protein